MVENEAAALGADSKVATREVWEALPAAVVIMEELVVLGVGWVAREGMQAVAGAGTGPKS